MATCPEVSCRSPFFTERYACVAARPLNEGQHPLPLDELAAHDLLVVSPAVPGVDGSAAGWFEQQGPRRRAVASVPSFFMALEYLRQSDMVAFVPSRQLPSEGLLEVPLQSARQAFWWWPRLPRLRSGRPAADLGARQGAGEAGSGRIALLVTATSAPAWCPAHAVPQLSTSQLESGMVNTGKRLDADLGHVNPLDRSLSSDVSATCNVR
jgi:hypothetical protein